jgi:hypothetical protein
MHALELALYRTYCSSTYAARFPTVSGRSGSSVTAPEMERLLRQHLKLTNDSWRIIIFDLKIHDGADPGESVGKDPEQSAITEAGLISTHDIHQLNPLPLTNLLMGFWRFFGLGGLSDRASTSLTRSAVLVLSPALRSGCCRLAPWLTRFTRF